MRSPLVLLRRGPAPGERTPAPVREPRPAPPRPEEAAAREEIERLWWWAMPA